MSNTRASIKSIGLNHDFGVNYFEWKGNKEKFQNLFNDGCIILLSQTGLGKHKIDFKTFPMQGYQLHLILPGQYNELHILDQTEIFQLAISRQLFESFYSALRFSIHMYRKYPVLELSEKEFLTIQGELLMAEYELQRTAPLFQILAYRIKIIFQQISRVAEQKISEINRTCLSPVLCNFLNLLDLKFKEERTVGFYAEQLNIKASYLSSLTKRYMGLSAITVIQNKVLVEAKSMLLDSKKSIKNVMFDLGFEEQSYFSYFFKSLTGITPSEFRKRKSDIDPPMEAKQQTIL